MPAIKLPKMPKSVSKMLESKYVLYVVLFLAATNLLGYMMVGRFTSVIFFILVGYLTYNFTKNMIIVLMVPLILTSVLVLGGTKEGFEESKDVEKIEKEDKKEKDADAVEVAVPTVERFGNSYVSKSDTMAEAYKNLNSMLGSDGIKNLTNDTKNLVEQQKQLMDAMSGMAPLMEQAQGLLKGIDMNQFKGIADMAKQFMPTGN